MDTHIAPIARRTTHNASGRCPTAASQETPGITYEAVDAGTWFSVKSQFPLANKGKVEGMIYSPAKGSHDTWRICYGDCTEHASFLRGQVNDKMTLAAAKAFLENYFRHW